MRIAPVGVLIVCLALGLTGCSSLAKKKSDASGPGSVPPGGKAPAKFPTGSDDPILQGGARPSPTPGGPAPGGLVHRGDDVNGILAGTVIDRANQKPHDVYIRYVCLDDPKPADAPIDVAVMPGGYFTIRGLQPNRQYKLIARGKVGDKVIAGVSYAKTPNIRVAIELREDFAGGPPEAPGAPAAQPPKEDKSTQLAPSAHAPSAHAPPEWMPLARLPATHSGLNLGAPRPVMEPDLPARVVVPPPQSVPPPPPPFNAEPPTSGWVPGIASDKGKNSPPLLGIPNNKPSIEILRPVPLEAPPPPPVTPKFEPKFEQPSSLAPIRVPSCVLTGRKLHNLALNDTSGKPWEYKTQRKGKLLLLDFWGTWCPPCRETIPTLRDLQAKHGSKLEVIGIAYEGPGTPQEQASRVNAVAQRLQINYRQLLGGPNCPVQAQFGIAAYPTLVLLDETGTIIWRHEGKLEQSQREDLELLVQRQLAAR